MKFSTSQIEILKNLSSEYKKINPFATLIDSNNIVEIESNGEIFLSNENLGYLIVRDYKDYVRITDIYSSLDSPKAYSELLNKLSDKKIKYVGVYKEDPLEKALKLNGFEIVREHHQLVKILDNEKEQKIEFKDLSDIDSEKILEFINLYAPDAKYTLEEITKKKHKNHSFYVYKEELIGIVIAFSDPLRKNSFYLEQIVIKKSQQGKGYGKRALKQILHLAQKNKFKQIRLHVYKDNKVAYNLYIKQRFKKDKIIAYWESKNGKRRV